jgi:hypothetical protein
MGLYVAVHALREATVARLLDDPPLVRRVLAPDDPEAYATARAAASAAPSGWSRWFRRRRPDDSVPAFVPTPAECEPLDLDTEWHGLHYLLNQDAWGDEPRHFLTGGGTELAGSDVGHGPARVLSPAQTRLARDHVRSLSDQDLRARFDPAAMRALKIYPDIWHRDPDEDDTLGYVMESVPKLRAFLDTAVANGHGLLVALG